MANSNEPGRREANKVRTRAAVYDALLDLLADESIDTLTAERVADAAGISRRTFFNYFPSIEAVLAHRQQEVLDQLRRFLVRRPLGESLADCASAAIDELFTVDLLAETARLWRLIDRSPAATRYTLEVSQEVLVDLAHDWVRQRAPLDAEPDDLWISVFTAVYMAAFDAARRSWMADHEGPVDSAARDDFVARVRRALDYLRPSLGQAEKTAPPTTPTAPPTTPTAPPTTSTDGPES